jgi:membrane protein
MFDWLRHRLVPTVRDTFKAWSEDEGPLLSAAMAYYAAFSLFPLCLVLISILGVVLRFWSGAENAQAQLLELVGQNTTPWLADQLQAILAGIEANAGLGGPIGLVMLTGAAIGIFMQLEKIFDRIWREEPQPSTGIVGAIKRALFDRLSAFLMLLGVGLLLVVLLLADVVLASIRIYVVQLPAGQNAWTLLQLLVSVLLNALLFTVLYKVLPKQSVGWREALAGGVLVAVIWEAGQLILAPLVIGEKYSAYGVVGSFIAVMLWMYYASAVLFIGAEFVQILWRQNRPATTSDQAGP